MNHLFVRLCAVGMGNGMVLLLPTIHSRGSKHVILGLMGLMGLMGLKYRYRLLINARMNPNMFTNKRDIVDLLLPITDLPHELRQLILVYSGHLKVGHRSLSFLVYF